MWSDGTTSQFPPILRAHSGWWYKPEQAQYDGKKTFGMGSKGHELAQEWHTTLFNQALGRHRNAQPVKIGSPLPQTELAGNSEMAVAYMHPVYGEVKLALLVYTSTYSRRSTVGYNISFHRLAQRYDPRVTLDPWGYAEQVTGIRQEIEPEQIEGAMEAFRKDPWKEICAKTKLLVEVQVALDPPDVLLERQFEFGYEEQEFDGVRTFMSTQLKNHLGTEVRKVVREQLQGIMQLGAALKYFGVDFDIHTTYGTEKIITGLTISIPPNTAKGNEEGHKISIRPEGVNVECGYVRKQQEYHQYEIQKAKKVLQGFDTDTFEDFKF